MPTFQPHIITLEAETSMRGEEIQKYLEKKLAKGRLRINSNTIDIQMQKKPRKAPEAKTE